ncbi:MAG: DUF6131 family protein [Pseudonocardia sp.]
MAGTCGPQVPLITCAPQNQHAQIRRATVSPPFGRSDSGGPETGGTVIVLGIILIVLGLVVPSLSILKTIGIILLVVGLVLLLLGSSGRALGGRKHWY